MKNNFRNCLIFKEKKLFSTNFRKHNNTLFTITNNYLFLHIHEFATSYIKKSNPTLKLKEVGSCVSPSK